MCVQGSEPQYKTNQYKTKGGDKVLLQVGAKTLSIKGLPLGSVVSLDQCHDNTYKSYWLIALQVFRSWVFCPLS